ncbi:MAG: GNAT family N-acetyltransferase [Pseudomonadota bacterium]
MQCACLVAPEKSGLLIFREMTDNGIEIVVLEAFEKGARIGARLLNHLIVASKEQQKSYLTATTTNDNWPALRFYQKYGFHLHELRKGAVDEARSKLKPKIPIIGYDELPIRDEIELRLVIAGSVENLHEN